MDAVLLIGHGSLKQGSGASMIRLAAQLRKRGVVALSTAAFLNFSKPTFQEGLTRLIQKGARRIFVQPYFLIDGYYVHTALRKLVEEAQSNYPRLDISMTQPFGMHRALVDLVINRIQAALSPDKQSAIILMAHGTPTPEANQPIYEIASQVEKVLGQPVRVAFMECNEPSIPVAIEAFMTQGYRTIIHVPYFLHIGTHVQEDLPEILSQAQQHYPDRKMVLAEHLGFDLRLAEVIEDRLRQANTESLRVE